MLGAAVGATLLGGWRILRMGPMIPSGGDPGKGSRLNIKAVVANTRAFIKGQSPDKKLYKAIESDLDPYRDTSGKRQNRVQQHEELVHATATKWDITERRKTMTELELGGLGRLDCQKVFRDEHGNEYANFAIQQGPTVAASVDVQQKRGDTPVLHQLGDLPKVGLVVSSAIQQKVRTGLVDVDGKEVPGFTCTANTKREKKNITYIDQEVSLLIFQPFFNFLLNSADRHSITLLNSPHPFKVFLH